MDDTSQILAEAIRSCVEEALNAQEANVKGHINNELDDVRKSIAYLKGEFDTQKTHLQDLTSKLNDTHAASLKTTSFAETVKKVGKVSEQELAKLKSMVEDEDQHIDTIEQQLSHLEENVLAGDESAANIEAKVDAINSTLNRHISTRRSVK